MLSESVTEDPLNARSNANKGKMGPAKKITASSSPAALRPAPRRWQRVALAASLILLAAWLIALVVMAQK